MGRGFHAPPSLDFLEDGLVQDKKIIEDKAAQDHHGTTDISQDKQNKAIDQDRDKKKEVNDGEDRIAERRSFFRRRRFYRHLWPRPFVPARGREMKRKGILEVPSLRLSRPDRGV